MPLVSVIIPTFNRSHLIMRTVESVLKQTLLDIEIIIVNDGSSDNTEELVSNCTDPRVRYVYKENGGVSSARNTGIDIAIGDYLCFLDDDDEWANNYLEDMTGALENNPDYGAAYCPFPLKGDTSSISKTSRPCGHITKDLFQKGIVHIVACLIRRDLLDDIRFDTALKIAEDSDFLLRVSLKAKFIFITSTNAIRNPTEISLTSNYDESRVLSLERFYFHLGGAQVIPKKIAFSKLSKSSRSIAKHYSNKNTPRAAKWFYRKAIAYRPSDLRNYVPYLKAVFQSVSTDAWESPKKLAVDTYK